MNLKRLNQMSAVLCCYCCRLFFRLIFGEGKREASRKETRRRVVRQPVGVYEPLNLEVANVSLDIDKPGYWSSVCIKVSTYRIQFPSFSIDSSNKRITSPEDKCTVFTRNQSQLSYVNFLLCQFVSINVYSDFGKWPTVRLHDSIQEESFHYLVFDL